MYTPENWRLELKSSPQVEIWKIIWTEPPCLWGSLFFSFSRVWSVNLHDIVSYQPTFCQKIFQLKTTPFLYFTPISNHYNFWGCFLIWRCGSVLLDHWQSLAHFSFEHPPPFRIKCSLEGGCSYVLLYITYPYPWMWSWCLYFVGRIFLLLNWCLLKGDNVNFSGV